MNPVNNIKGIDAQEKLLEGNHVVILLLVKPSDKNADDMIKQINYLHYRSDKYCSIYLVGYSIKFGDDYKDVRVISGIDNQEWQYSDKCFLEACDELKKILTNWRYSGEPEMIILQNNSENKSGRCLDFSNYYYIDINYGIKEGYIDSFQRFMERVIDACRSEITANEAIIKANKMRISPRKVFENAVGNCPRLPKPLKKILKDKVFFKSYKSK